MQHCFKNDLNSGQINRFIWQNKNMCLYWIVLRFLFDSSQMLLKKIKFYVRNVRSNVKNK